MVDAVDGIERIRYTSPHPKDMREDVIRAHAELPAVCEHIHLPLQSGSSRILKAMRRTYNRERYLDRVALIREHVPDCALTTDIIVGFPGETEEDFARDARGRRAGRLRRRLHLRLLAAARHRGGDARRPGPARGQARADGAPGRGGPAPGARARAALRRPHDGGAGRGRRPSRPDAAARPHPPQQGGQLRGHRGAGRAGRGRDRVRDLADADRPRAAAQPRPSSAGPMRVLAIFGPTAVGKTGVAIEVAELLRERGEDPVAISCDAIQVYRGSRSSAARPRPPSSARLEHRLVGHRRGRRGVLGRALRRARPRRDRRSCSPPGGGRSWSAAPASTCARRSPSSSCARRCPRRSAPRSRPRSPSAGPRRFTPSSRRSSPPACIPTTASGSCG